jgi:hypothetical protein
MTRGHGAQRHWLEWFSDRRVVGVGDATSLNLDFSAPIREPYPAVARVLAEGPLAWLPDVEVVTGGCTAEIGIGAPERRISRRVLVEAGTAQQDSGGMTVSVRWSALEHPDLYPRLAGRLRLEPSGPGSRLRLDAGYLPPAGRWGAALDRALLHQVAEASVREFVERVAIRLARGANFIARFEPPVR